MKIKYYQFNSHQALCDFINEYPDAHEKGRVEQIIRVGGEAFCLLMWI
jgi:hypothetical protein